MLNIIYSVLLYVGNYNIIIDYELCILNLLLTKLKINITTNLVLEPDRFSTSDSAMKLTDAVQKRIFFISRAR